MKKKLLSIWLTVSLLIPMLSPLTAMAEGASPLAVEDESIRTATETETVSAVSEPQLARPFQGEAITDDDLPFAMTEGEILEQGFVGRVKGAERDLHSIVMEKADGSLTLHYYNHPVKYVDGDGKIRDKSDKLQARSDGSFETVSSDIRTAFPKRLQDGITMQKGNHTIRMAPAENLIATGTLSADQTTVTYAVNARTRYEYSLTAMGFKEDIVVAAYTGQTEYSFTLQTGGLTAVNQYGTWVLVDEDNTVRASLSDVIVFTADERNNTFGELRVEEITAGQTYRLTVVLDADWLADPKTAYPITIDPSVNYANTIGNIEDLVVGTSTTYNGASASLYVGRGSSGAKIRTLMRFPNLNISGYNVTDARIELRDIMCEGTAQTVECYEYIGTAWQEGTSIPWSGMGSAPLGAFQSSKSIVYGGGDKTVTGNSHRYAFNITALAQKWAAGTASPSKGVIFKATDDYETGGTKTFKTFASINRGSNQPSIVINYATNTPTITLTPTSKSLYIGETVQLSATTSPTQFNVRFVSSNPSVASVNSNTGLVTGISAGSATITASADGAAPKTCTVTVNQVGLTLDKTSVTMVPGETVQLNATTTPSGRTVAFVSSNPSVAEVSSSGLITAKAGGTATITASTNGATSKQCTVSVGSRSLSVNASQYYQAYDSNLQLWYSGTQPAGTTYTWSTSKSSVATITASGTLQFHNIGSVDVTVTASTGDTATKTFYGIYPDGVYKIQNTGSYLYATLENNRIVEDVNISQFIDQSEALKQLWRVHYLGDGEYVIRSMQNPALIMAMDAEGNVTRNVMAYNLGISDDNLPDRAKWYFRGTTYSMFTEATVNNTTYRLVVASGDTSNYSNIYAASDGTGAASWRLVAIDTVAEGVVLYNRNTNVTGTTYYMNIGSTKQLTAIFYTTGEDTRQEFYWESDNPSVAIVDTTGKIYAVDPGTRPAKITAISKADPRCSAYCYVYVDTDTDFDGITDVSDGAPYTNTFTGTLKTNKTESTVSYTMDYRMFLNSSTTYNETLSRLSSLVATITYSGRTFTNENTNIEEGINKWMERHGMLGGTADTNGNMNYKIQIGQSDDHKSEVALGYRPIIDNQNKVIVVAVIVRGTDTSLAEWSSNMDVGNTNDFINNTNHPEWTNPDHHMGFDITANRIYNKVTNFVNDNINSTTQYEDYDLVYWVTGHSRGGAIANLVAADLIDSGNTVFAYTFAAPGTVVCDRCKNNGNTLNDGTKQCAESSACPVHATKYNSIFNIVNEDDFLTYFPLKQWYFTRYGRTTQGVSVSGTNESGWVEQFGIAEYMHMASPRAPLDQLYLIAPSRNDCYDMSGFARIPLDTIHPTNTEGFYYREDASFGELTDECDEYQSPMFLMKYFAAIPAKNSGVDGYSFVALDLAPYLELARISILLNIPELEIHLENPPITINLDRVYHPHLPETYRFITENITQPAFQ